MGSLTLSLPLGRLYGFEPRDLLPAFRLQLERLFGTVVVQLDEWLISHWPFKTGTSLRGWAVGLQGFLLFISNAVDYVEWVHPSGQMVGESGRSLADERDRLLRNITPQVQRLLRMNEQAKAQTAAPAPALDLFRGIAAATERRAREGRRPRRRDRRRAR